MRDARQRCAAALTTDGVMRIARLAVETREIKRYPSAKPVPAVDRATADWQALDLTNAPEPALT